MCFLLQTHQLANLQGYKENSTGEKSKTRFYLLGGFVSAMRSTPRPNGPRQRKKMSCHLVLQFRNHEYSAPLCGRTSLTTRVWVWSLYMILGRCQAPKTTRPVGRLPLIVSYVLILLKAYSTLHLNTHTHTKAYIYAYNMTFHPKPNIHLSCLSTNSNPSIHLSCLSTNTTLAFISYGIISWSRQNIGVVASKHTPYLR